MPRHDDGWRSGFLKAAAGLSTAPATARRGDKNVQRAVIEVNRGVVRSVQESHKVDARYLSTLPLTPRANVPQT